MELSDLKQLAASDNPVLQQHALQIWEKEWSRQPEILFAIFSSEDKQTLEIALNLASAYYPERSGERIAALMENANPVIRRLAVQALVPAMKKYADEKLKKMLKKEKDVFVLASAVTAAARLGFDVALIEPFLNHKDIRLRANTVRAAAILGKDRLRELLEPKLKDVSYRVQNEALKGLAQLIAENELEKLILKRLEAKEPSIRAATAFLTGELPLSRKIGFLIEALRDDDQRVVVCSVRSLLRLNDPIGLRAVLDLYLNTDNDSLGETMARLIAPVAGERLLAAAEKHAHPARADEKTVGRVLAVAICHKDHEIFLPWILAALRNFPGQLRLSALGLIARTIDYFKHDISNLLDLDDLSPEEKAWKNLIIWKAGRSSGLAELKEMLFSGRPGDVKAAVAVLRHDNSLIARNYLKQAINSGILLAMDPETLKKNIGSKPISLPDH